MQVRAEIVDIIYELGNPSRCLNDILITKSKINFVEGKFIGEQARIIIPPMIKLRIGYVLENWKHQSLKEKQRRNIQFWDGN